MKKENKERNGQRQMAVLLVAQGTLFAEYMGWHALRLQSKTIPTAKCIKQFCINESPIKVCF